MNCVEWIITLQIIAIRMEQLAVGMCPQQEMETIMGKICWQYETEIIMKKM
jgi:hypothetical protein